MVDPDDAPLPAPADGGRRPGWTTPASVVRAVQQLEDDPALDRAVEVLERAADVVAPPGPVDDVLTGRWLGHALHPLLTDFPLGSWLSASLLDLFGGRRSRPAATGLVAFGVAAAVPTAAAGLAELRRADQAARRVAVVHAGVNASALLLYATSLRARLRGHHGRGVGLALAGGVTATIGGWFGGHLSLARKTGTRDARFVTPGEDEVVDLTATGADVCWDAPGG